MAKHCGPGWQLACSRASKRGIMTRLSARRSSVKTIPPTRAMSRKPSYRRLSPAGEREALVAMGGADRLIALLHASTAGLLPVPVNDCAVEVGAARARQTRAALSPARRRPGQVAIGSCLFPFPREKNFSTTQQAVSGILNHIIAHPRLQIVKKALRVVTLLQWLMSNLHAVAKISTIL